MMGLKTLLRSWFDSCRLPIHVQPHALAYFRVPSNNPTALASILHPDNCKKLRKGCPGHLIHLNPFFRRAFEQHQPHQSPKFHPTANTLSTWDMPHLPASHVHPGVNPTKSPPSRKQGRRRDMSPHCAISLWQRGTSTAGAANLPWASSHCTPPPQPQLSHQEQAELAAGGY